MRSAASEYADEARRRERSPRLLALVDALQTALYDTPSPDPGLLERACLAYGAALNTGAELREEDVDLVAAELLWPAVMAHEGRG